MKYIFAVSLFVNSMVAWGQVPQITNFQPVVSGPTQTIVVNGSGFSSTSSQLNVSFDGVKGSIVSSTPNSIQVKIPPQARYSNIEVLNTTNFLSSRSALKFTPSFGGQPLSASVFSSTPSFLINDSFEFFDVVTADFDLDGKPDIASSRAGLVSSVSVTDIYLFQNTSTGIGNINFTKYSKSNLPALNLGGSNAASTTEITAGDLNGDGKPDIVCARGGTNRNEIFILQNTNSVVGTMSFVKSTSLILPPPDPSNPTANVPLSFRVAIRDLNNDGNPEVIVANSLANSNATIDNTIFVFQNTSNAGTLSFNSIPIQLTVTGASTTYGLDVQDVDGDSMADIIVNQFFSSNVYIFRNTSTSSISFAPVFPIPAAGGFANIITGDINNDGLLDLVATSTNDNSLRYWINSSSPGNISFPTTDTLVTDNGPFGIDLADIDGDKDVDIIVANKNGSNLNVFRNDQSSPQTFTKFKIATPSYLSRSTKATDFDGDGKPDLLYTGIPNPGQYGLIVLRNTDCWNPVITTSTQSPSPAPICTTQTIRLQTQPALGATYTWQKGATTVQSGTLEYFDVVGSANAGSYSVTVNGTVDTGCSTQSTGFSLVSSTGTAPANPTISNNVPCLGSTLSLSTPAVTGATYSWKGPNGFTSSSQTPSISPVLNATAGYYLLQVTVGPCQSNVTTKQLDVASVPVLPITATPSAIGCAGATITLSVSGSGYTFQWNKGGSAISGQTSSSLSLTSLTSASEGDYSVVVTSASSTCSQETAKTSVKVFAQPSAAFAISTPDCAALSITFTDQTTGADSRGTLQYTWNFSDSSPTSSLQSPSHVYLAGGNYSPNLTVGYQGVTGCTSNLTKPLVVNTPVQPSIQASANPICVGDPTTLSISGSYTSIAWVGVTGTTSNVSITQPGKYKVNTTDANGCTAIDSVTIGAKPLITPFTISTYQNKSSIAAGDTLKLTATAGADSYAWTPATSLSDAAIYNPVAKPASTTTYKVVAKKSGSCDAVDSLKVIVETGTVKLTDAPVLFSPNGDNWNDRWVIPSTANCATCVMTIYDGHGSQVYQSAKYFGEPWDGNYNGQKVPDGTYFYVFGDGSGKPATGSVLVVR